MKKLAYAALPTGRSSQETIRPSALASTQAGARGTREKNVRTPTSIGTIECSSAVRCIHCTIFRQRTKTAQVSVGADNLMYYTRHVECPNSNVLHRIKTR